MKTAQGVLRLGLILALVFLSGCTRAPSFDIIGSFFPAWLLCLVIAVVISAVFGGLFRRLEIPIPVPVLTYTCMTAFLTLALWLIFFA
jgi:hypothetical protein